MTQEEILAIIVVIVIAGVLLKVLKGATKIVGALLVILAGLGVAEKVCPYKLSDKSIDVNEVVSEQYSEDFVKVDDDDNLVINIYDTWYRVSDISSVKDNMDNSYTIKVDGHSYTVNNSELTKIFKNLKK